MFLQGESGIITETESYISKDYPACNAAKGRTKKTEIMFGPAGFSYVYLIYGMHYCLNFVTEKNEFPAAVLIRGIYINSSLDKNPYINGTGKLCKFFGINKEHNNLKITDNQQFYIKDIGLEVPFMSTPRIGITKGVDKLWRYVINQTTLLDKHKL